MTEGYMIFRNVKPKKQLVLLQVLRDSGFHGMCDDYETKEYLPINHKIDIIIRGNSVTWIDVYIKPNGVELDLDMLLTIKDKRYTKDILKILNKQGIKWYSGMKTTKFNPFTHNGGTFYIKNNELRYDN